MSARRSTGAVSSIQPSERGLAVGGDVSSVMATRLAPLDLACTVVTPPCAAAPMSRSLLFQPVLLIAAAGCAHLGPSTIPQDRFDYSASISDSWKRQTLLNVVKLRYLDLPIFVDVGQIVSGYSLSTNLGATGSLSADTGGPTTRGLSVTGAARFEDRPTVTYTPLTGSDFVRGLMTPLPPDQVFATIQAGWPVDGVLRVAVSSMNGLRNQSVSAGRVTEADPGFLRVLDLMRQIQPSGGVGFRLGKSPDQTRSSIVTFRTQDIAPETLEQIAEVRRILHLDPEAQELKLVYAATSSGDRELAVLTNSMLHIMMLLSAYVDIPPEHVKEGRAMPGWEVLGRDDGIDIRCSDKEPEDAFVAVEYRKHWFWIDDRSLMSKRALVLLMMLFTLADTGEKQSLPLITIPAQ